MKNILALVFQYISIKHYYNKNYDKNLALVILSIIVAIFYYLMF